MCVFISSVQDVNTTQTSYDMVHALGHLFDIFLWIQMSFYLSSYSRTLKKDMTLPRVLRLGHSPFMALQVWFCGHGRHLSEQETPKYPHEQALRCKKIYSLIQIIESKHYM